MPSASSFDESRGKGDRYTTIKTTAQFQVVLVKASVYTSDSKKVVDYLMQNKTVVLNLEGAKEPDIRRIIDFVVGAAYAMPSCCMPVDEVVKRLEGIQCGSRPTSCPDQLAKALKKVAEEQ